MKVADVVSILETIADPTLAADWDNVGLLVGDTFRNTGKLMLCIDLTEQVLAEAVRRGAKMVMAYHPVIFKPVSRVTATSEPVLFKAIGNGIAVYSMHTALDAAAGGTNDVLADAIGLKERRPMEPASARQQSKIVVFCPVDDVARVSAAAFEAGAGVIGDYSDCAFASSGTGMFCGGAGTLPAVGTRCVHETVDEVRLERLCPTSAAGDVYSAIAAAHSYEEPAIDVYRVDSYAAGLGMGRVGSFARPVSVSTLISRIKKHTGVSKVLLAGSPNKQSAVKSRRISIAACGAGACGPMWKDAAACGAEFFLTGEMRHHDALAAVASGVTVVCVGHSNSERMALHRLAGRIRQMCDKLELFVSATDRDPFDIV